MSFRLNPRISLESIDTVTKIELQEGVNNSVAYIAPSNLSSKRYEVTKDLIEKLLNGREIWVKVNLDQEYVESKFSVDVPMGARNSMRKFYNKAWGVNSPFTQPHPQ